MPAAEQAARNRRREGGGDVVFMGFRGFYRDNQPPASRPLARDRPANQDRDADPAVASSLERRVNSAAAWGGAKWKPCP